MTIPRKMTWRERFLCRLMDLTSTLGWGRLYQWLGRRL